MKLNVGSDGRLKGWVNVDLYNEADVKADIRELPFKDNSFTKVLASHILEHIPLEDVPQALGELVRVCQPGGRILIRVPDSYQGNDGLAQQVAHEGWDGKPGFKHYWDCSEELLLTLTKQAGLDMQVIPDPPGWPKANWVYRQIILVGQKPTT